VNKTAVELEDQIKWY